MCVHFLLRTFSCDTINVPVKSNQVIVGVLVGLILGFFLSEILRQKDSSLVESSVATEQDLSQLPEGHPTPELMARLRQLETTAQADPRDKKSRVILGNAYYDIGRFVAAIPWYREALELDPEDVNIRTDLATCYLYVGDAVEAVKLYRQSLSSDPSHAGALQNIGVAYFSTGHFSEAIKNWEKLIESHPHYHRRKEIEEQIEKAKAHLEGETP